MPRVLSRSRPAVWLLLAAVTLGAVMFLVRARNNIWSWSEIRHICHSCGMERLTRRWTLLQIDGFAKSRLEPTRISAVLDPERTTHCDHNFIVLDALDEHLALNPAPLMRSVFSGNGELREIMNNTQFLDAMSILVRQRRPAARIWENLCLFSMRPGNSNVNSLLQMIRGGDSPDRVAAWLNTNSTFNPKPGPGADPVH